MILMDTSIWIDFLRQRNESLNKKVITQMEEGNIVAFSAVFGELFQGVKNEREENIILEFWNDLPQVDDSLVLIDAGRLSAHQKLFTKGIGLIDCSLLAACKKHNFE